MHVASCIIQPCVYCKLHRFFRTLSITLNHWSEDSFGWVLFARNAESSGTCTECSVCLWDHGWTKYSNPAWREKLSRVWIFCPSTVGQRLSWTGPYHARRSICDWWMCLGCHDVHLVILELKAHTCVIWLINLKKDHQTMDVMNLCEFKKLTLFDRYMIYDNEDLIVLDGTLTLDTDFWSALISGFGPAADRGGGLGTSQARRHVHAASLFRSSQQLLRQCSMTVSVRLRDGSQIAALLQVCRKARFQFRPWFFVWDVSQKHPSKVW